MSDEADPPSWHDRMNELGPRADVPVTGGAGSMPYARPGTAKRRSRVAAYVLVALVGVGGAALAASLGGGGSDDASGSKPTPSPAVTSAVAPAPSQAPTDAPATSAAPTTTEARTTTAAPSTTTDAPTTTAAPATTTAPSTTVPAATASIPVEDLPRHEAVYRDGKLILQGTVPSAAVRERFRSEAAAVIGADNVIVRYQIDPRVPVPTDGRVRVDEAFLFAKNSASIDDRYRPLMDLGVRVMQINPQARMRISGYTDDSGSDAVNLELSQARADALKGYLTANGIDPARAEAVGRGETDFVAPNDTPANRARNRRIEIDLLNLLTM